MDRAKFIAETLLLSARWFVPEAIKARFPNHKRLQASRYAEALALQYFLTRGFVLLEQNIRFTGSEIDLVMTKDQTIHFIEVKLTPFYDFRFSFENLLPRTKQAALRRGAHMYCSKRLWLQRQFPIMQFDLFLVQRTKDGAPVKGYYWPDILY